MHGLSIILCSASFTFANARVDSCQARIRKCIHSRCRISESTNCIAKRIAPSDVHTLSQLLSVWFSALYSVAMGQKDSICFSLFSCIFFRLFVITIDVFSMQ